MLDYQGEKFKRFLSINGISTEEASKLLNKNKVTVYQYFKSKNLSREVVSNILKVFQVKEEAIWGNEGPVESSIVIEADPISLHPHREDRASENGKFVYAGDGTIGMKVKIVPAKAYAGYLVGFADPEYYEDLDYEIIAVEKEHGGTYLGFEVKGDSMITTDPDLMEQNIYPGWRAIGRDLPKQKWKYKLHTHSYDKWILVHRDRGILIKQIVDQDIDNGIITIHSLNPDYKDEELSLSDIEQIFSVVQVIAKTKK